MFSSFSEHLSFRLIFIFSLANNKALICLQSAAIVLVFKMLCAVSTVWFLGVVTDLNLCIKK